VIPVTSNHAARWLLSLATAACVAQALDAREPSRPQRVGPPKWTRKTLDLFFPDARQKLVGPRPDWGRTPAAEAPLPEARPSEPGRGPGWSQVIAAETLEGEVKAALAPLEAALQSPTAFKGGGFKQVRQHFSVLAAMFAVIADYDGEVRWKRQALAARDRFARAGLNAKVASDAVYQEARRRLEDLKTLLQGGNLTGTNPPTADWSGQSDRPSLMARMEQAETEALRPALASAAEFGRRRDKLRQEAQVLAALARLIRGEGHEDADDEQYARFAEALERLATETAAAAGRQDYEAARKAAGGLHQSCDACHAEYRG
jgi:hypothetical protein